MEESAREEAGPDRKSSAPSPVGWRAVAREPQPWILVAFTVLVFLEPLFFGRTLSLRDLSNWAIPQRHRLVELWRSSGLPLRDPFIHGGFPFLGELNNAALYPTAVLGFLLGSLRATNVEIALHVALCAIGAYALARVLGLGRAASVVAGAAFAFSGVTLSLDNLFNRILAMPHLCLLILFWHLYIRNGRLRWFVAASATGALMIFAGSLETLLLSGVSALAWSFFADFPPGSLSRPRRVASLAALGAVIVLLAAIQILPAQRLAAGSLRRAMPFLQSAEWSLAPKRLPELVYAGFLGRADTLRESDSWGRVLEDSGFPYLLSVYLGVSVIILSAVALAPGAARPSRRFRVFLAVGVLLAVLAALGRHFVVYPALYRLLPPLRFFRYPVKFLWAATLPLALLAACGAERLLWDREGPGARRLRAACLACFVVLLAIALAASNRDLRDRAVSFFFLQNSPSIGAAVAACLWRSAAIAGGIWVIALLPIRAVLRSSVLALLVVADLSVAPSHVNPTAPAKWMEVPPPLAREIRPRLGDGRFYGEPLPHVFTLSAPTDEDYWHADWQRQVLGDFTGAAFDIPLIFHSDFDGLAPARLITAGNVLATLPWTRRMPLLSAAAVRFFVAQSLVSAPGAEFLGEVPNRSDRRFYAYRNAHAASRETLVSHWSPARSAAQSAEAVTDSRFDPRSEAVLETRSAPSPGQCGPGAARTLVRTAKRTSVLARAACPSFLVFSEPWDEGWQATVDGTRQPIERANLLFMAVAVPGGDHRVEIRYRPASVGWGAAVSGATACVLVALLVAERRRFRGRASS